MPQTRFEECWPLPTESLPEIPQNLNIVALALTVWPINFGVLSSLLLPHLSSSLTNFLPSLNLLCHSKTDARFMQDGLKAVWIISYVSGAFFPSLKQNFIAYRPSKESDCIFEIHQLWQSSFSRVYSNSCCSYSFEPEIIKIGQSSHKIYSNNILNFQVSTTILNSRIKKSLETYRMHLVYCGYTRSRGCLLSMCLTQMWLWTVTVNVHEQPVIHTHKHTHTHAHAQFVL